jgi:hypothetical protein
VDGAGVTWLAVTGLLSLFAAWWKRPNPGDTPIPVSR